MSWDTPQFPQGFARRPVSLRCLVAHAREIVRSDPAFHPALEQYPRLRNEAVTLTAAAQMGAPLDDLEYMAARFARTLIFVQNMVESRRAAPKTQKGAQARDVVEAARQRKEAARPANVKFPADSLFGGLQ